MVPPLNESLIGAGWASGNKVATLGDSYRWSSGVPQKTLRNVHAYRNVRTYCPLP